MENPNYIMVRAMSQSEKDFAIFFDRSVVGAGWCRVNFSSIKDPEQVVEQVRLQYYSDHSVQPQVAGRKLNEVRRFKSISPGDRIMVPYYSSIRLALAEAEEIYDPTLAEPVDLANQRRVSYRSCSNQLVTIPRKQLSDALQRRLRVPGSSVSDLNEFTEELDQLWSSSDEELTSGKVGWLFDLERYEAELAGQFKATLLKHIQEGLTNLQSGGIGLEHLILEMLKIEGYAASIPSKQYFPSFADADIIASRSDRINGETKLLIQVKHHKGTTDTWGANQLLGINKQMSPKFYDHRLVLVTSGHADEQLTTICESQDIVLIDGDILMDWLYELLGQLSKETRAKLGITNVPGLK